MDGVLCNFSKKFIELTGENIVQYAAENGWVKTWDIIENEGVEFWSELEWMDGGEKLWSYVKNLPNLEILTGSPKYKVGEYAKEGKDIWIERNIGNIKVNHTEGILKYLYVKNNDILIDDSKRNCDMWEKAGGIAILHINVDDTIKKLNKFL